MNYFEFFPIEINIIILSKVENSSISNNKIKFVNFFNTLPEFNTHNNIINI